MEATLDNFERKAVREFFKPEDRSGLRALSRGEAGVILSCRTLYFRPVSVLPLCCSNLPVRLIGETDQEPIKHFITPKKEGAGHRVQPHRV